MSNRKETNDPADPPLLHRRVSPLPLMCFTLTASVETTEAGRVLIAAERDPVHRGDDSFKDPDLLLFSFD